ncbi:MAG: RDD family protein [Planctomycetes bacterium]|nr:RDD family protein [Planctomycetota bacterium]
MSSRHPAYLTLVLLLSLILSAPQLFISVVVGFQAYQQGWGFWPQFVKLRGSYRAEPSYLPFWRDKFVQVKHYRQVDGQDGQLEPIIDLVDPDTGQSTRTGWRMRSKVGLQLQVFGDRLFLISHREVREVADGVPVLSKHALGFVAYQDGTHLEFEGEPAFIQPSGTSFAIMSPGAGLPGLVGNIILPDPKRNWMIDNATVSFGQLRWLTCVVIQGQVHLFGQFSNGLFLHRVGMDLERDPITRDGSLPVTSTVTDEMPVSALHAANTDGELAGWSVVFDTKSVSIDVMLQQGLVIDGQPAALQLEGVGTNSTIGRLCKFDGSQWSEFTTVTFPFGSNYIRALPAQDGQRSYLVASTSMGRGFIYVVDASGVRQTSYDAGTMSPMLMRWLQVLPFPMVLSGFGFVLGLLTWFLMWWFTKPDYGFGLQQVALASLGRRGLARLIDIGLILLSTVGLGWLLTRDLDWIAAGEAFNLDVAHPARSAAENVAVALLFWVVACLFLMLVTQARWGISPGKWCCGLRVLRTTLQPCGMARTVTREVILYWFDALSFLCWTPGILAIALTERRQRPGDFVADTIVVTIRSLRATTH